MGTNYDVDIIVLPTTCLISNSRQSFPTPTSFEIKSMMTATQILDREYLEIRGKILEVAASLDRLDRAEGNLRNDARMKLLHEALQVLVADEPDRAEQVQMICSRSYDDAWQEKFFSVRKAK
jgi:hypothetical protein